MSTPFRLTPEDIIKIDKNRARLERIGDRACTGNLLADWEAEQRAAENAARQAYYDEQDRRRQAEEAQHSVGADLPLFTS